MAPDFNSFPTRCFLLIFDSVPLQDLLVHCGLVCKRWQKMQRKALTRRKTLVLSQGFGAFCRIKYSVFTTQYQHLIRDDGSEMRHAQQDIELHAISCENRFFTIAANRLAEALPNITNLQVAHNEVVSGFAINSLLRLLDAWAPQLVTFKYWADYSDSYDDSDHEACSTMNGNVRVLFWYLNKLSMLKHLTFEARSAHPLFELQDFAFISRLQEFLFFVHVLEPVFYDAWKCFLEPSKNLKIIDFRNRIARGNSKEKLEFRSHLEQSNDMWPKFKRNPFEKPNTSIDLQIICSKFTSITELTIGWEGSLSVLVNHLQSCTQLVFLSIDVRHYVPYQQTKDSQPLVAPNLTVKAIDLEVHTESHQTLFSWTQLANAFPNMRSLGFSDNRRICSADCEHFDEMVGDDIVDRAAMIRNCFDTWLEHLKLFLPDNGLGVRSSYFSRHYNQLVLDNSMALEETTEVENKMQACETLKRAPGRPRKGCAPEKSVIKSKFVMDVEQLLSESVEDASQTSAFQCSTRKPRVKRIMGMYSFMNSGKTPTKIAIKSEIEKEMKMLPSSTSEGNSRVEQVFTSLKTGAKRGRKNQSGVSLSEADLIPSKKTRKNFAKPFIKKEIGLEVMPTISKVESGFEKVSRFLRSVTKRGQKSEPIPKKQLSSPTTSKMNYSLEQVSTLQTGENKPSISSTSSKKVRNTRAKKDIKRELDSDLKKVKQKTPTGIALATSFRCKWANCGYVCHDNSNMKKHVMSVHFKLPRTLKRQREKGLVDDRNPSDYIDVISNTSD